MSKEAGYFGWAVAAALFIAIQAGWVDDNKEPVYDKATGAAVNCRAYVQVAIDGYLSQTYTAQDTMMGLQRNCGRYGYAWKNNRS